MIDKLHLKVELDNNDMNLFSVSRSAFLEKNNQAKIVLRSILKNAYEQTGFDIFNQKMLVEIFPTIDSGCILLFTITSGGVKRKFKVTSLNKSIIFSSDDINNILDFSKIVSNKNYGENSLYKIKDTFYLVFHKAQLINKNLLLLADEYCFKKSRISFNFLSEHGQKICENNAISRLSGCREK